MIKIGDKYKVNAICDGETWIDFGICPQLTGMYGRKPEDIREVEITIKEVDVWLDEWYKNNDENDPVYFGYYDYKEDRYCHSLMRCNAKVYNSCFPYGADNHCWIWENGMKTDKRKGTTFIFEING